MQYAFDWTEKQLKGRTFFFLNGSILIQIISLKKEIMFQCLSIFSFQK